jgi:hypothetical protein
VLGEPRRAGGDEGDGGVEVAVRVGAELLEHLAHDRQHRALGPVPRDPVDQDRQPGDGVGGEVRRRRVSRLAERGDEHREARLLRDADGDRDPAVREWDAVAPALVDRLVDAQVRPGLDEPLHPDRLAAVLLVGLGDQHEVAARANPSRASATAFVAVWLFMSTAPRPQR